MRIKTALAAAGIAAVALAAPSAALAGPYAPGRVLFDATAADATFMRQVDGWASRADRAYASLLRCGRQDRACHEDRVSVLRNQDGPFEIRWALNHGSPASSWKPPTDSCARLLGQRVAYALNTWSRVYFWSFQTDYREVNAAARRFIAARARALSAANGCSSGG